jgi:hypothetical protein
MVECCLDKAEVVSPILTRPTVCMESDSKQCYVCKATKPTSEFGKHASRKDRLQAKCKECTKANSKIHYRTNLTAYKSRAKRHKEKLEEALLGLKSGKPCMDCGAVFHPCAMDFDHRDPSLKEAGIRALIQNRVSVEHLLREVAKCDLVCACCHRVRTHVTRPGKGHIRASSKGRTSGFDPVNVGSTPAARTE